MKKTLVAAVACAALTPAAWAQSSVTLYGLVDAGYNYVSGLRGGSKHMLASGIMEGSRLGVRVNEDLGGGWRAVATMEHRAEIDIGGISNRPPSGSQTPDRLNQAALLGLPGALQPAVTAVSAQIGNQIGVNLDSPRFWDRQIFVGLVTPVGAVLAGRQYTPAYEVAASFDTLATQSSLAVGQVSSFPPPVDIRISNSVQYRIQTGPFTGSLMVAASEGSAFTGRLLGAGATYKGSAFSIGAAYNTRENERGDKSLTTAVLGASAPVGPVTIFGLVAKVTDDNPSGLSGIAGQLTPVVGPVAAGLVQNAFLTAMRQDAYFYQLGAKWVTGPHTIYTAYNLHNDRLPANADSSSFGGVYTYSFSKRTDVNFVLARFVNDNLAQTAPGGAGFLGGVTAYAGKDATNIALGLRHRF